MSTAANRLCLFFMEASTYISIKSIHSALCLYTRLQQVQVQVLCPRVNMPVAVLCVHHAWNAPAPCMEYACTMHGICLYHAWNTLNCTTHGMYLEHAFRHQSMHVTCMFHIYLKNVPNPCMLHACFRNHACNMHEISNYAIIIVTGNFMHETFWIGRMKCAETCMEHACFRHSILRRDIRTLVLRIIIIIRYSYFKQ